MTYLFAATNFTKLNIILIFEMLKKKNLGQFAKNDRNLSLGSQKYGFGIRDPGPGVKKAPYPGSRSATLPFSNESVTALKINRIWTWESLMA
jgi:hypothetical protein